MKRFSLIPGWIVFLTLFLHTPSRVAATPRIMEDRQTTVGCPKSTGGTSTPVSASTPVTPGTAILTPEELVTAYFTANMERRYEPMAALYSDYSLAFYQLSHAGILSLLLQEDFQGVRLLDFKLIQSERLSDTQYLLTVMVRRTEADGRENTMTWKMVAIYEQGSWKFNVSHTQHGSLIDYKILTMPAQTNGKVTIQLRYIARYMGGIMVGFCLYNGTKQTLVWTWVNEAGLTLTFGNGVTCIVPGNTPPLTYQSGSVSPDNASIALNCPNPGYPTRITFHYLRLANSMGLPADSGAGLSFTFMIP